MRNRPLLWIIIAIAVISGILYLSHRLPRPYDLAAGGVFIFSAFLAFAAVSKKQT
jgi:hypothetical protein